MNDGTDAMYEMETWASPDTNRTDITTLYAGVAERMGSTTIRRA